MGPTDPLGKIFSNGLATFAVVTDEHVEISASDHGFGVRLGLR